MLIVEALLAMQHAIQAMSIRPNGGSLDGRIHKDTLGKDFREIS